MDFKQMRINLAAWIVSAPESDEELGSRYEYYSNLLYRRVNPLIKDDECLECVEQKGGLPSGK